MQDKMYTELSSAIATAIDQYLLIDNIKYLVQSTNSNNKQRRTI